MLLRHLPTSPDPIPTDSLIYPWARRLIQRHSLFNKRFRGLQMRRGIRPLLENRN
jgi:hypothetical protein